MRSRPDCRRHRSIVIAKLPLPPEDRSLVHYQPRIATLARRTIHVYWKYPRHGSFALRLIKLGAGHGHVESSQDASNFVSRSHFAPDFLLNRRLTMKSLTPRSPKTASIYPPLPPYRDSASRVFLHTSSEACLCLFFRKHRGTRRVTSRSTPAHSRATRCCRSNKQSTWIQSFMHDADYRHPSSLTDLSPPQNSI